MNNSLTAENLLSTLPQVLSEDDGMRSLAESIAAVLSARTQEIKSLSIYAQIYSLPDALLDILSYDFKIDWWSDSLSLDEKRETFARSFYVHKHMGTPAAVKTALSAIYPNVVLEEWWEYGGKPYHFRLKIPIDEGSVEPVKHAKVMSLVRFYKNLRSVLDSVEYLGSSGDITAYSLSAPVMAEITAYGFATMPQIYPLEDELGEQLIDEYGEYLIE